MKKPYLKPEIEVECIILDDTIASSFGVKDGNKDNPWDDPDIFGE